MTPPTGITSRTAADLDRAARAAIAVRFRVFAGGCLLPMVVWTLTLALMSAGNGVPALATLGFQVAVLAGAGWWLRRAGATLAVPIVVASALLLAVSAIVLFTAVGSTGEVLGFVLFTVCAMAALVFPWGWRHELGLTATVLAIFALAFPRLRFALAPVELTPVITIAAALCVAIGEGHARNFRATLRRRWSEEEALHALAESRDTYRDITENARDFIWASDLEGRISYVNEAGARILGFAPSELVGRNVDPYIVPAPTSGTPADMRERLAGDDVMAPTVVQWRTPKGNIWVEVVAYTVRNASGDPSGFRGISRDVTERYLAEAALRESEARYRGLVESQDALIYRADRSGNLTFLNEACRRFYGVEHEPLSQLNFLTFVHPDEVEQAGAALAMVAAGGRYRRASRGHTPSGWRWIEWEVCAIADGAGVVSEVQGVGHDVTERLEADAALQRSLAALREREEQLRGMSLRQAAIREEERKRLGFDLHDGVCQELVGIGILIESARQRGVSSESAETLTRAQTYLRAVGEHLRQLARDLRPLQLSDLGLGECLRTLATGMVGNGTSVTVGVPRAMPRLGEEVEVAVYRVAQEALANAVRHARARRVALTLATNEGMLALEVRDDGVGFDRSSLQTSALGLVAMEERALALGGRLSVQSTPGGGTTVRLECPIDQRRAA